MPAIGMMLHAASGGGGGGGALTSPATITVDHTKCGTANTANFVMLFSTTNAAFKSTGNGGSLGNVNDFRFASDSGGASLLTWEIVKWDSATGLLVARVNIGTLTFATDAVVYLLFDGSSRGSFLGGSAGAIWDTNYKTAFGFGDGSSLVLTDLTTNANNATNHNTATAAVGPNGLGAVQFVKASTQYLSTTNTLNITHPTLEGWFYLPPTITDHALLGFDNGYLNGLEDHDITLGWEGGAGSGVLPAWYIYDGGGKLLADTTARAASTWHYVVGTADGTTQRLYVDGAEVLNQLAGNAYTGYSVANLFIGGGFRGIPSSDIKASECRVSDVARSASYVLATWNNYNAPSTFYALT